MQGNERVHDILARHAADIPDQEAVVDEDVRWTYRQLAAEVDRYASALIAAGVRPGDRVATLAPPSKEFWVSYLATVSIGAIWLGLNPRYRERDYRHVLDDARPRLVLVRAPYDGRQYDEEMRAIAPDLPVVTWGQPCAGATDAESWLAAGRAIDVQQLAAARAQVGPDDTAVIVYTSGTTGTPKGAMLSHRGIAGLARINAQWMGSALNKTIMPAPINHIGGLNNVCMNVFAYGGCIVFFHRVDAMAIALLTLKERPSYLVASPTAFRMLLDAPGFRMEMLSCYRLIVFGGAKSTPALIKPFLDAGIAMAGVYGQTETTGIVTATRFSDGLEVLAETVGRALPEVELRVADPQTHVPLADGVVGELQVRSTLLMKGYYQRPEATAETFTADGFLKTGDLVLRRADGNYEYIDRIKEMFKSGGYNIYPVEIEQALCEHPDVTAAAVLRMPDVRFDEVGFAFVVVRSGVALQEDELKAFLRDRIANYKVPKRMKLLAALPLLPNSKVDKQALRAQLEDILAADRHA